MSGYYDGDLFFSIPLINFCQEAFGDKEFYKNIFRIALPIASANLLSSSASLIDTVMVGQLCFATVQTLFYLLGASVLVFMYTRNDPDRRMLSGVIAAALYVMAPFILLMIGIADQAFHFRTPQAQKPD